MSFGTRERRSVWALAMVGSAMTFADCSSASRKLPGQSSSSGPGGVGGSAASAMVGGAAGPTAPTATGGNAGGLAAGAGGTSGAGGVSGGIAGSLVPPLGGPPTPESAGPMVMRRLTNREYSHILSDLLADATNPGATFLADVPSNPPFEAPTSVVADVQIEQYLATADSVVGTALANGNLFANGNLPATCQSPAPADETTCAGQFITAFGLRAFRRPVETDEVTDLQALFTTARGLGFGFQEALAEIAKGMLQSPSFLYHWEIGATPPTVDPTTGLVPLTPWQVAARLAATLWESGPDDDLLSAAQGGRLATPAQVGAQASRMLADPRAARALEHFHEQLLIRTGSLADLPALTKSSPRFTAGVAASLPEELNRFLTDVYLSGDGTLNTLLTAPYAFVDANLAPIYGVAVPAAQGFTKVALNPVERGGLLTQLAFLSSTADNVNDNPVARGIVVYQNLLCGTVPPDPSAVPPLPVVPTGPQTTRQRWTSSTAGSCATGCHAHVNPPGFAFENYDGLGVFRTTDSGLPVDSTGTMVTPGQVSITFTNAIDLSRQLAASPEVRWCLDRQWFRYMLGRPESAAEQGSLEVAYRSASATDGYSLRALLTAMVTSKAFLARAPSPGELP